MDYLYLQCNKKNLYIMTTIRDKEDLKVIVDNFVSSNGINVEKPNSIFPSIIWDKIIRGNYCLGEDVSLKNITDWLDEIIDDMQIELQLNFIKEKLIGKSFIITEYEESDTEPNQIFLYHVVSYEYYRNNFYCQLSGDCVTLSKRTCNVSYINNRGKYTLSLEKVFKIFKEKNKEGKSVTFCKFLPNVKEIENEKFWNTFNKITDINKGLMEEVLE